MPGQGSTFIVQLPAGDRQDDGYSLVSDREADLPLVEDITSGFVDEAMRWLDNQDTSSVDAQAEPKLWDPRRPSSPGSSWPRTTAICDVTWRLFWETPINSTWRRTAPLRSLWQGRRHPTLSSLT